MPILPQTIKFSGKVHKDQDLSAIANFEIDGETYLAIGSDESKQRVQLLKQTSEQVYDVDDGLEIKLPVAENPDEIDIESITFDRQSNCLYIAGSHSKKRKTVKVDDNTAEDNRVRLAKISPETLRNQIFQVKLDTESGKVKGNIKVNKNLKEVIKTDPYLKSFIDIPSKENGIDIEGLAIKEGRLYLGFRGPVLRGNYVPVIVTQFDDLEDYEIRFVQLGGNGIRDITAVENGFLIISGPVGDAPGPYRLYFWDGADMVYGRDRLPPMPPALIHLEDIAPYIGEEGSQGKAEGITVLEETATAYQALIIYDSLKNGNPQLWRIGKPGC